MDVSNIARAGKRKMSAIVLVLAALVIVGFCPSMTGQQQSITPKKSVRVSTPTTYLPSIPRRARAYYSLFWGVDSLNVRAVESGELIRFSYRVLDGDRAKSLNDKKLEPFLIAPEAHLKLVIPSLEKVGQLRQSSTPESGKVYWMAFSNPGRAVKRGDRVNVVIGQFHADGLVVE
jgi:hypothetical protein